jgi:hypothetical protein
MLVNRIEPVASLNSWASAEVGKGIVCRTLYQAAGRRVPGFQTVVWPFAEESTNGLTASLSLYFEFPCPQDQGRFNPQIPTSAQT